MKCVILVNKKKILYLRRLLVIYNIFNFFIFFTIFVILFLSSFKLFFYLFICKYSFII